MANDRRSDVLRAIISDYVSFGEPVGSKALVEKYDLGVSSATVRNDMSALEDAGYIYQPHTSAGRVPTQKGYRAFVDQIATLRPLSQQQRNAIEMFLSGAYDLDDVVERTARLLAQLTQQLAVIQYPTIQRSTLHHIEIVRLDSQRLLVVIITDSGQVEQRQVRARHPVDENDVVTLRAVLNAALVGRDSDQMRSILGSLVHHPQVDEGFAREIVTAVESVLASEVHERIVMAGTANLVRSGHDFSRTIGPVLDALEEQVALLRLFQETEASQEDIAVSIGAENRHDGLVEASIISGTYGTQDGHAHLGVVGPTRMDYPTTMSAVRAVARYLSRLLAR